MSLAIKNLPDAIRSLKAGLRKELPAYAKILREIEPEMRGKVAQIIKEREAGEVSVGLVPKFRRQGESLTRVRVYLNQPWKSESEGRIHFAPDNFEVDFRDRGTAADLTPLGCSQLGHLVPASSRY